MHNKLTSESLSMQSSGIGSLGSMPTLDDTSTASCSDDVAKNTDITKCADVELGTAAHTSENGTKTGVYVTQGKRKWSIQKCDCLFKKICIVYMVIIVASG